MERISILHPLGSNPGYKQLTEETMHDLSLDTICEFLSHLDSEKAIIRRIMMHLTGDPETIRYRLDVFEDILNNKPIRDEMQKLLDKVEFLKIYSSFGKDSDSSGIWQLIHRLDELNEYINAVEAMGKCLDRDSIKSQGLTDLRKFVKSIYEDNGYEALKKDIKALKMEAADIQSVTLGINLNDRLEPIEIGIASVNKKPFTESKILHNISDLVLTKDQLNEKGDWNGSYDFRKSKGGPAGTDGLKGDLVKYSVFPGLVAAPSDSKGEDIMRALDRAATALLNETCKKLREMLSRHVSINISIITDLIPEFLYYVRWAEFVEKMTAQGHKLCKPVVLESDARSMKTSGIYNLKLISKENSETIVGNDLDFSKEHRIYILTGANRGGKTTITQAVGIAFLMAQGGVFVPADSFEFAPADNIFTHFPADENKTMDLGRLGEESKRFKDIFKDASKYSLLLLNESFSTTSFEEGYFIARDVTKAMAKKGCRVIFNTHMHKLAMDYPQMNAEGDGESLIESLVVESEGGNRSFKVSVRQPEGLSYAMDIAKKYGVTYDQLFDGRE